MTTAVKGREPVTTRLLPVIPALTLDLPSSIRIWADGDAGRRVQLTIRRPSSIDGELSIDRASVLNVTVEDPDLDLFANPVLSRRLTLSLGQIPEARYISGWVMNVGRAIGGRSREGSSTVLTFWALGEAALKSKTGTKTWPADKLNLEGWVRAVILEVENDVDLRYVVPRPNSSPPRETESSSSRDVQGTDGSSGSLGFSSETAKKITVKGKPATPAQLKLIDRVLRHNVKRKDPARAVWGQVTANIGEAQFDEEAENPTSGALGLFQLMPPPGWQARLDYKDIEKNIDVFMDQGFASGGGAIKICRENPRATPGEIASKVEGSDQGGRFYDAWASEARTIIELWSGVVLEQWHTVTGPAGTSDPRDQTSSAAERPTVWRVGSEEDGNESYWTALGRNADGLGRRRFITAMRLVVARDQDLILAAPHMSFTLTSPLIAERPALNVRGNAMLQSVSLRVFAAGWTAPHGSVVDIRSAGFKVDGPWIVRTIGFRFGDPILDIELQQPTTKIPSAGTDRSQNSASVDKGVEAAINWAEQRIGWAEQPKGSNAGPQIGPLIKEQGGSPGQAWCGYFCRGALRAGGLNAPVNMAGVAWINSASAARTSVFRGRTTPAHAKAGDLAIFGTDQHVGLIVRVNVSRQELETIEGNHSDKVERVTRKFSELSAVAQVDWAASQPRPQSSPTKVEKPSTSLPLSAVTA